MIKEIFGRMRKPLNEILLEAISELGKQYSRLELAYLKLAKRDKELFEECASYLSKGMRNRAVIYANEIAEVRKMMSFVQGIQLSIEKAILRLETLKAVTPTMEDIKGVFSEVKSALEDISKAMPSLTPELSNLMNSINDLIASTEMSLSAPEPLVIRDEATEAILKEASNFIRQDIERKIPEPPKEIHVPEPPNEVAIKPRIALTVDGLEFYVDSDGSIIGERSGMSNALAEEIILDYVERNNGEMNISKCAKELNMSPAKIMSALESLSRKGKIRIE
ncbi:MAG: Snf7 family protein [Candidatus Bathyarchaeota archaeon]|nr:Snf7 family protein [Candidatus Bathyarchaeota archaeon]